MKEAMGNSYIFYIIITFIALLIGILTMSLSYSKAFKIKNSVIETIERYGGYTEDAQTEIEKNLGEVGYRVNGYSVNRCPDRTNAEVINPNSLYRYCIYRYTTSRGVYYGATTYMYFDIPLVSGLEIPIYGETKIFFNL